MLTRLLASEPENDDLLNLAGYAYFKLEQYDDAYQVLRQAVLADPNNDTSFRLLSLVFHKYKNFAEELKTAEQAAHINPENPDNLERLSSAQSQNGLLKQAQQTIAEMLKLDPESESGHFQAGSINLTLENYTKAEEHYRFLLQCDPNDAYAMNNLAIALKGQKKTLASIELYADALKADSQNDIAQQNLYHTILEYIGRGQWLGQGKKRLQSLPENLQNFFHYYRKKSHPLERFTVPETVAIVVGLLAAAAFVVNLFY